MNTQKNIKSIENRLIEDIKNHVRGVEPLTLEQAFEKHLDLEPETGDAPIEKSERDLELELHDYIIGNKDDYDQWI